MRTMLHETGLPDITQSVTGDVSPGIAVGASRVTALGVFLLLMSVAGHGGQGPASAQSPAWSLDDPDTAPRAAAEAGAGHEPEPPDLSGTWEIREEDRTYIATLDARGNGPYTHQGGTFTTTAVHGRVWSGTWAQTGNDREGGFEVRLSEDGSTAEGDWWYTRVGLYSDIPPRFRGGSYVFQRLRPPDTRHAQP